MTDRGLPIADGAPACPFVAFEDDREERASAPDTRHRCYAEVRPAPRAQAHQDAYCLSSAFPLCPTFQDWARRESARVRDVPQAERLVEQSSPRNPARDWTAPPPWLAPAAPGPDRDGPAAEGLASATEFVGGGRRAEAGLAGSLAHRIAMDVQEGGSATGSSTGTGAAAAAAAGIAATDPSKAADAATAIAATSDPRHPGASARRAASDDSTTSGSGDRPDDEEADDGLTELERTRERARQALAARWDASEPDWSRPRPTAAEAPGLEAAVADLAAHPGGISPEPVRRSIAAEPATSAAGARREEGRSRAEDGLASLLPGRGRPKVGDTRGRGGSRGREQFGPPWERPHRYEAYPTLRTRMGLPAVSRVFLLFVALLLAAVALFFLPTLLGFNAPKGLPAPSRTESPSSVPSGSVAPSIAPLPTVATYVIQPGDTMSGIAAKLGVPLADLIAANKEKYPNPDRIVVGDTLIVPAPVPSSFGDAGAPQVSTAP